MTRTAMLALALTTLVSVSAAAQSDAAVSKGIHDREVQWRTAISMGSWPAAESFMAEDFVMTLADGTRLNRAQYLKELQKGTATYAPVPEPDYKVLVYASTAVHLGEAYLMATGSDGASLRIHIVWTDTWVRTAGGQWVVLASQQASAPAT